MRDLRGFMAELADVSLQRNVRPFSYSDARRSLMRPTISNALLARRWVGISPRGPSGLLGALGRLQRVIPWDWFSLRWD